MIRLEGGMSTASTDTALHVLYRDHHGWLRGWLRQRLNNSADAADLAQDTFVRVLVARTADNLREPRHYLSTVARGLVIDLYRRRSLEQAYLSRPTSKHSPCVQNNMRRRPRNALRSSIA